MRRLSLLFVLELMIISLIFYESSFRSEFIKFCTFLGIQESTIMGGCIDIISPPKSQESFVDGGVGTTCFVGSSHPWIF